MLFGPLTNSHSQYEKYNNKHPVYLREHQLLYRKCIINLMYKVYKNETLDTIIGPNPKQNKEIKELLKLINLREKL